MNDSRIKGDAPAPRPDIVAATRGGDNSLGMEGEASMVTASLGEAVFWRDIYQELLTMEKTVLARIRVLQERQSPQAQREVELTNVPVIVSQVERFRARLGYWDRCVQALEPQS